MGLDVWFRQDVARILASAKETMSCSIAATPPLAPDLAAAYEQGFSDALRSAAIAFGLLYPNAHEDRPTQVSRVVDVEISRTTSFPDREKGGT